MVRFPQDSSVLSRGMKALEELVKLRLREYPSPASTTDSSVPSEDNSPVELTLSTFSRESSSLTAHLLQPSTVLHTLRTSYIEKERPPPIKTKMDSVLIDIVPSAGA
jgi:hypothetical protein